MRLLPRARSNPAARWWFARALNPTPKPRTKAPQPRPQPWCARRSACPTSDGWPAANERITNQLRCDPTSHLLPFANHSTACGGAHAVAAEAHHGKVPIVSHKTVDVVL